VAKGDRQPGLANSAWASERQQTGIDELVAEFIDCICATDQMGELGRQVVSAVERMVTECHWRRRLCLRSKWRLSRLVNHWKHTLALALFETVF
jgi:hypothetical protein